MSFRRIRYGVETMPAGHDVPRHRHDGGYATVVLAGRFSEASFAGRATVGPGDVLLHGRFDCHGNAMMSHLGTTILRLPWEDDAAEGLYTVADPDALARLCEQDPFEAAVELGRTMRRAAMRRDHWVDALATDLDAIPELSLARWAEERDLTPESLSRGFRRAFGTSPKSFRMEARARRARLAAMQSARPLTEIAHDLGFADLAHMTHSVRAFTGLPPSRWRAARG